MAKLKRKVGLANKAFVVASPGGVVSACAYTTRAGAERALDSYGAIGWRPVDLFVREATARERLEFSRQLAFSFLRRAENNNAQNLQD
jgi:hypothetical protein